MFETKNKIINSSFQKLFRIIFWIIGLSSFLFQCYIPRLSAFLVPSILGYVLLNANTVKREPTKGWMRLFAIYVGFIILSAAVSVMFYGNIGNVIRFSTILLFIPFVMLETIDDFRIDWIVFKLLLGIKALSIISIWVIVFWQQDYIEWRSWANSIGAGDIYILSGIPRVQLQGNSLLLFAALCDFEERDGFSKYNILMLFSVLCSGNSAFFLGLFLFFSIRIIKRVINDAKEWNRNGLFLVLILVVFALAFLVYSFMQLEMKSAGVEDTNRVRIEQAELLLDTNPVWGAGVGAYANGEISTRVYYNETYYELQTLYIFHQIGLIGMLMFMIITVYPLICSKRALRLYLIYLIYAFWNPYSFDSTHIVVLIVLVNVFLFGESTCDGKLINERE